MSTTNNKLNESSYYLLNIQANSKLDITHGFIVGRFTDANLPQSINRKLARIELITNNSNINTSNNYNQIGYLILLKNFIRINDKEYTFHNDIKPIPIHVGDILNLVHSQSKKQQYQLEICRNISDKHILRARNRKRKRSEQLKPERAQSMVYNKNNTNKSVMSIMNNTNNKMECHNKNGDPPKKKRKLNHDINAIVPDISNIDQDEDDLSTQYKFEAKPKKNHDKKDIIPILSDDSDDEDNDDDMGLSSQIHGDNDDDQDVDIKDIPIIDLDPVSDIKASDINLLQLGPTQKQRVTETDVDESEEEQEDDESLSMQQENDKTYAFLDGVYGLLVPTKKEYKVIEIKKDEFKIGRHNNNDLVLPDAWISGWHCEIQNNRLRSKKLLWDTSTNGTFVNGKKINGEHSLQNGDLIQFIFKEFEDDQNMNHKPRVKIRSISYYFILLELFDQSINYKGDEFNVILSKSKENKGDYNLCINDEVTVYREREYDEKQLSKLIGNLASIPEDLSKEITKFYGNMIETISYNIACKRPNHVTDKPFLPRSSAMLGSPIDPNL